MKRFIFLFLLFHVKLLYASDFQVEINGSFPGAEGQMIRLMEYSDMISYREKEIAYAIADEEGNFRITFTCFGPQYVFFRVDYAKMGMFVEPGITYSLEFDPVNFSQLDDTRNPWLNPWYFNFVISEPKQELNYFINELEELFFDFLEENFAAIHISRNRSLFDSFKKQTDSIFQHVNNEYFRDYYEYKFAFYYRLANIERFDRQMNNLIVNRPVLYNNTQYMNFFNRVFDTYIFAGSRSVSIQDLTYTVNKLNSYHALMDSLGKDTLLRNEVLRELVLLKALQDMYGNFDFRQENVENILNYIQTNSKFHEHRQIAGSIIHSKNHLSAGSRAPEFTVYDQEDNVVNIPGDFEGKFIYLGFWATWCETCLLEMIALQELYETYNENFVFVNISTDRHRNFYQAFIDAHKPPWHSFHFDRDFRLIDAYQVRTLPAFVLIDEKGNIIQYPARKPSDDLKVQFDWLLNRRGASGHHR